MALSLQQAIRIHGVTIFLPSALLGILAIWVALLISWLDSRGRPLSVSATLFPGIFSNSSWLHRWGGLAYLNETAGDEHVVAELYCQECGLENGLAMRTGNSSRVNRMFSEVLAYLGSPRNLISPMYLADSDIPSKLLPDVPNEIPSLPGFWKSGTQPTTRSFFLSNGSASEYHYDVDLSALVVQVSGTKQFVIAPPEATSRIGLSSRYCRFGAIDSSIAPSNAGDRALNVSGSESFQLEPGDTLYIPKFHWHAAYLPRQGPTNLGITVTYFFPERLRFSNLSLHPLQEQCARALYGSDTLWLSEWL